MTTSLACERRKGVERFGFDRRLLFVCLLVVFVSNRERERKTKEGKETLRSMIQTG
jgi:hypothetical protein